MTPSIKTLERHWDHETAVKLRAVLDGTTDPETYDSVDRWVRQCYNQPSETELGRLGGDCRADGTVPV